MNRTEISPTGLKTHYLVQGEGPPVVLLHGAVASMRQWQRLADHLAANGYRVYALDLLGHGESERLKEPEAFDTDALYEHFSSWLKGLDLDRPPLVLGHSMGGYLGLRLAAESPGSVQALVLVNPFYTCEQLQKPIRFTTTYQNISSKLVRVLPTWLISTALRFTELRGEQIPKGLRRQIAEDFLRTDPNSMALPWSARDMTPSLPEIDVPALVVWGNKDFTLLPETFPTLCKQLPRVKMVKMTGGHMPHHSQFDAFIGSVDPFLRQQMKGGAV